MSRTVDQVLDEAMTLSAEERIKVAEELLRSVDGPEREEIDAAWAALARERLSRFENGDSTVIGLDEAVAEVQSVLRTWKK